METYIVKKIFLTLLAVLTCAILPLSLSACSDTSNQRSEGEWQNPSDDTDREINDNANILVVYFSVPDSVSNSYVEINGEILGNNQYFAYVIQENTGANIFRILPETPYPTDHNALLQVAQEERRTNARPAIKDKIENFDSYDVVFVGYPNWNADLPNILYTFFDTYDFSGKTIIPFMTHGGSSWSGTRETIARLEPNATLNAGLSISRNSIQDGEATIINWLEELGYKK